ncbi:MAG: class I SAM-dependent methyltransferase [Candidatus Microgenomates bacterium]
MKNPNSTSWGKVASWYNKLVGNSGHYYHEKIIFPNLKRIYQPKNGHKVLDVGCGQGVYGRLLPSNIEYTGIDISKELILEAKKLDLSKSHSYFVADATDALPVESDRYDLAISILALQNMKDARRAIAEMARAVKVGGKIILVLNHPAFRIPRQSSWGVDEKNKLEYRRINRYLSSLNVPINAHPGRKNSPITWSYHQPISYYVNAMVQAGCPVTNLAEWVSDKQSQGKAGKMENRARNEFPLFLLLEGTKSL